MTLDGTRSHVPSRGPLCPANRQFRMVRIRGLVERAQAGDGESLGLLYDRHIDAVYAYIHSRVLDQRTAEMICSEAFLHAVRELSSITGGEPEFGDRLLATADILIDLQLHAITAAE